MYLDFDAARYAAPFMVLKEASKRKTFEKPFADITYETDREVLSIKKNLIFICKGYWDLFRLCLRKPGNVKMHYCDYITLGAPTYLRWTRYVKAGMLLREYTYWDFMCRQWLIYFNTIKLCRVIYFKILWFNGIGIQLVFMGINL